MPRTHFDPQPDKLQVLFDGYTRACNKNTTDLGTMLGCSRQYAAKKIKDPGMLTVRDLRALGRGLNISLDEIREAIQY